ncbi:MAG: hypothetical protein CfClM3_1545 [Methanobrevibacter sp. CfCl-M3]
MNRKIILSVLFLFVVSSCIAPISANAGTWHVSNYGRCVVGNVYLYDLNSNKKIWSKHFDGGLGDHNWNVGIPDSSKYHTLQLRTNWWWDCPDQFQLIYMYDGGDVSSYNKPKGSGKVSITYKGKYCVNEGSQLVWSPE